MQAPWMVVGIGELQGTKFLVILLYKHDGYAWQRVDVRTVPYKDTKETLEMLHTVKEDNKLRYVEIWTDMPKVWKKLMEEPWCSAEIKHSSDIKKHVAGYLSIPEVQEGLIDFYELDFQKPKEPKKIPLWRIRLSNFFYTIGDKIKGV
mgnify:CR=1 FL=1